MDKNTETQVTWNKLAAIYQDKFMKLDLYNDSYDYFIDCLPKSNAKLLELGCGPGNISQYLLSKRANLDIFGIDLAPKMIELARLNNPKARFAVLDVREIDKLNAGFDGIIGGFCLPYLSGEECVKLIRQSFTLLNNTGILYLSFVAGDPLDSGFKTGSGGRVYFYYHRLQDLVDAVQDVGFSDIKVFNVNYMTSDKATDVHTILIAQKNVAL